MNTADHPEVAAPGAGTFGPRILERISATPADCKGRSRARHDVLVTVKDRERL
jgi:hypothetical protein